IADCQRIAGGDLDDVDSEAYAFRTQARFFRSKQRRVAGDHFRDDEACAKTIRKLPEGEIRYPGHRCEEGSARELHRAYMEPVGHAIRLNAQKISTSEFACRIDNR